MENLFYRQFKFNFEVWWRIMQHLKPNLNMQGSPEFEVEGESFVVGGTEQ